MLLARIMAVSAEHRQRAEGFESLAATEDWLNGAVSPMEQKPMPVYPLDIQQRFARISKQGVDEARKAKVIPFSPRLSKAVRVCGKEPKAMSLFKPKVSHPAR